MNRHKIKSVDKNSVADELGITPGCFLLQINGKDICDIIDYEHYTCGEKITMTFETADGEIIDAEVEKDAYEPMGIEFEASLMSAVRSCANHCIFCFIDQMPPSNRKTLHFKDDDWRLSLIMGNYITLTNVSDTEFDRIIERRISPLYISIHSMEGDLRCKMMNNKTADRIVERLTRLYENKLSFHGQIVLCPDINDGEHLEYTINELYKLYPYAVSVAVIPVGLTSHRDGLFPLRCQTKAEAIETIELVHALQKRFLSECGSRFVFAADEMYVNAQIPLPEYDEYEDFFQLENGVGLLRKFEDEFLYGLSLQKRIDKHAHILGATGRSAYAFLNELYSRLKDYNIDLELHAINNSFFGENVTVSGLVTAGDIIAEFGDTAKGKLLLIPKVMLRECEDVFLDGMTLCELKNALSCDILVLPTYDGEECARVIFEYLSNR